MQLLFLAYKLENPTIFWKFRSHELSKQNVSLLRASPFIKNEIKISTIYHSMIFFQININVFMFLYFDGVIALENSNMLFNLSVLNNIFFLNNIFLE